MAKNTHRPGRKVNKHHIIPKSRTRRGNKDKDNVVELDKEFHVDWHKLFENMTVAEVHRFIDRVMVPGRNWTSGRLHWLREEIMDESLTNSLGGEHD
ncbi:hypothetical protein HN588_13870 [Candidatus Bathyarchaeota archaeon]|nr:hypothetical protein [Candidatus Bathyarchaeota archaeon]